MITVNKISHKKNKVMILGLLAVSLTLTTKFSIYLIVQNKKSQVELNKISKKHFSSVIIYFTLNINIEEVPLPKF